MPIRVRLIRESGEQVQSVTDRGDFIARCSADGDAWRLLGYVDEYGDTYFNARQIPDFLSDWQAAKGLVESAEDEELWRSVRTLAEECQARTHLYLKFVGD
jgi:hypothetical protein